MSNRILKSKPTIYFLIPLYGTPQNLSDTREWVPLSQKEDPVFTSPDEFSQHISDLYNEKHIQCYKSKRESSAWEMPSVDIVKHSFEKVSPKWTGTYLYRFNSELSYLMVKTQLVYHYKNKDNKDTEAFHFNVYSQVSFKILLEDITAYIRQQKKGSDSPIYQYAKNLFPNESSLFRGRPEVYFFMDFFAIPSGKANEQEYSAEIQKFEEDLSEDATLGNKLVGDVTISSNGKCCENIVLDGGAICYQYVRNERYLLFKERECVLIDLNQFFDSNDEQSLKKRERMHNFVTNSFLFTYLFALHERQALTQFISKSVQEEDSVKLHSELLDLQKYYIYDVISDETRYQAFYTALLDYFGNEKLENEVGEINDRLAADQNRKKENLLNWILAYISLLSVISVLADIKGLTSSTAIFAVWVVVLIAFSGFVIWGIWRHHKLQ